MEMHSFVFFFLDSGVNLNNIALRRSTMVKEYICTYSKDMKWHSIQLQKGLELNPHRGRQLWTGRAGTIPPREEVRRWIFNKVWVLQKKEEKKKKKSVSSDTCEVVTEWEEREGRDRRIDDRRAERKKSLMYTAAFVFQYGAGKNKNIGLISVFDFTTFEWDNKREGEKKEQCGAPDDRGRTGARMNPWAALPTGHGGQLTLVFLPLSPFPRRESLFIISVQRTFNN